jgi:hypothetical protein
MSKVARRLGMLVLALVSAGGAAAQIINDSCAPAIPIVDGVFPGTNVGAGTGPDPVGVCGLMSNDVWYAYTASCNGTATAEFCNLGTATYDTTLAAWSGTCGCLTELACNDDTCLLLSHITFDVLAGNVYYVSAGGFNGNTGTFSLSMGCVAAVPTPPPTNDLCSGAITIVEGAIVTASNVGATTFGCPADNPVVVTCGYATDHDVWYVVVPACSGPYMATTCLAGTTLDTVLGIWDGTNGCAGLTLVACDDSTCALPSQWFASTATWTATAGTPYYISVGGYLGATGTFNLLVASGSGISLAFTNAGPGTIGYSVVGGPSGGTIFTAATLVAGAYPSGWFFGIDITFPELSSEVNAGFPFITAASSCGTVSVGPIGGVPTGLTVYGVALGVPIGSSFPTNISLPATATVP